MLLCCDDSGGRELKDEYGLYDGMSPVSALVSSVGLAVAIYLTKPPARGHHLLKLAKPPAEIAQVYQGRA